MHVQRAGSKQQQIAFPFSAHNIRPRADEDVTRWRAETDKNEDKTHTHTHLNREKKIVRDSEFDAVEMRALP